MIDPYEVCHKIGGMTRYGWEHDPKRLVFQFSRYKFVAKMLQGHPRVLEVGCADGMGARIVRQHVQNLVAIDVDPISIAEAQGLMSVRWPVQFIHHDIMARPMQNDFTAAYCLDLFEHIEDEHRLLSHLSKCAPVCIVGTPSKESQKYASDLSRAGHVNCKSGDELRRAMVDHWRHVFLFGMNDEVVHTGFSPMAHYLMAIGVA